MVREVKRIFIGVLIGLVFVGGVVVSAEGDEVRKGDNANKAVKLAVGEEDALDELMMLYYDADSTVVDVLKYLGWMKEDTEGLRETAKEGKEELAKLKKQVLALDVPERLKGLKKDFIELLDKLSRFYSVLEKEAPKDKEVQQAYNEFVDSFDKYIKEIHDAFYIPPEEEEIRKNRDEYLKREMEKFFSQEDRKVLEEILTLINDIKFSEAYKKWKVLDGKYKEGCAKSILDFYKAEILWLAEDEKIGPVEDAINIWQSIIGRGEYLPFLSDVFLWWRTSYQAFYGGVSNYSNIYNRLYNQKRREVIKTIKAYLKRDPGDKWARYQLGEILFLPNVLRGGAFGNTTIGYMGVLYPKKIFEQGGNKGP